MFFMENVTKYQNFMYTKYTILYLKKEISLKKLKAEITNLFNKLP